MTTEQIPAADAATAEGAAPSPTQPGYRALKAWQRGMDLAADAYRVARALPRPEQEQLAGDLRRSAAAVPALIAAGSASYDRAAYQRALVEAQEALARVETVAQLLERLGLATERDAAGLLAHGADVGRLLRGLARSIRGDSAAAPPPFSAPIEGRRTGRRAAQAVET